MKKVSFLTSQEFEKELERLAEAYGLSKSALIRMAIRLLEAQARKAGLLQHQKENNKEV